jgi:antitoxin PrlF
MATVTSRGRVTIPKAIRDALGIQPGAQVEFELEESRIVVRKRAPEDELRGERDIAAPNGS